ncbi:MAG: hypothetical protein AABZ61_14850, partial [Bacteroidota bacterium]
FHKALSGETIVYHSAVESAHLALLERATDGRRPIVWETEKIPLGTKEKFVTFIWLAGISSSMGVHKFDMFINNEHWFTFHNPRDSSEKIWTVEGRNGATLTFCAVKVDVFHDLFGYAFLKLPVSLFKKGEPLTIRVAGETAGSPAWYMTFQYSLEPRTRIQSLPALVSKQGSMFQLINVSIAHFSVPKSVSVYTDPQQKIKQLLTWGVNSISLPIRAAPKEQLVDVMIEAEDKLVRKEKLTVKPVQRRELYLLPHSHTDIGYSAHQVEVEKNHIKYIDQAIEIAKRTSSYPPEAQFKWNIEVLWALESYLAHAPGARQDTVIDAIKKGWIGVNGLYANLLTGLCNPEELLWATEYARRIAKQYGIPITTAMITDIPAYTSATVTALSLGGIKYFSSGPNYMPSLPDHGDRIGHSLKAWGDRPFYWVSRSGQSKVLFWMAGRGYSWFHGLNTGTLNQANPAQIFAYLNELDSTGYPYDIVQVRYTIGGDNGPPDSTLSDFVREWNTRYVSPRFVISTTQHMIEEFERRYGKDLAIVQGDLTPYWEDGAVSTAKEVALNRNSAETLVQAEALYALFNPKGYNPDDFYSAWRKVLLFDEHTWGAWNSISEPDSPSVKAQWDYKQAFAVEGNREAKNLMNRVLGVMKPSPSKVSAIDIVNTNSWARTDLVILPKDLPLSGNRVKDKRGAGVPSQRLSTGELAVLAKDVPPMSAKRLFFEPGNPSEFDSKLSINETTISNGDISLSLDRTTGAIKSLLWKKLGRDLVDTSRGAGLNQFFYIPGRDPKSALTDSSVKISVKEPGPLVASLLIESAPE